VALLMLFRSGLVNVANAVEKATQTSVPLFITEFGLQTESSCAPNSNCVHTVDQQTVGLKSAWSAITGSGQKNSFFFSFSSSLLLFL
jgi:hypothetical protein